MRKVFFTLLILSSILCPPSSFSQSVIRLLAWELNTSRPAPQEWQLVRGETVDLECRYLSGASAMDVRGAAVVLHCRTNGMPADVSYQVTGRVGRVSSTNLASVGWVTVRVRPDLDLPHDVKSCTFALETTLASARNLVATGLLRLSGDPTGATPAAVRVFQYDDAGSAQAVSNALVAAVQTVSSVAQSAAQQAESNRVALAALPPPSTDALRLINSNATQWIDGTGAVWNVYSVTNFYRGFCVTNIAGEATNSAGLYVGDLWTYSSLVKNGNGSTNRYLYTSPGKKTLYYYTSSHTWTVQIARSWGALYQFTSPAGAYELTGFNLVDYVAGTVSMVETNVPIITVTTSAVDRVAFKSDLRTLTNGLVTADQVYVTKELHADSYTNLIWRTVWSNGWCWAVAFTNTP